MVPFKEDVTLILSCQCYQIIKNSQKNCHSSMSKKYSKIFYNFISVFHLNSIKFFLWQRRSSKCLIIWEMDVDHFWRQKIFTLEPEDYTLQLLSKLKSENFENGFFLCFFPFSLSLFLFLSYTLTHTHRQRAGQHFLARGSHIYMA